jgi:hypothetical protein
MTASVSPSARVLRNDQNVPGTPVEIVDVPHPLTGIPLVALRHAGGFALNLAGFRATFADDATARRFAAANDLPVLD